MAPLTRLLGNIDAFVFRYTGDAMKGYRTILVALAQVAIGIALVVLVPEQRDAGMALVLAGISMAGLRVVTDSPMGGK
jgi:hypothetical protein